MADKSAEKERLFNEWFTKSYERLRGKLRLYGMLDEDNFHDTYLFVRRQVLVPGKDITDYDAYFIGCYKKAALVKIKRENRYAHPEDDFFLRCGEEAKFLSEDDLNGCERLVKDILRFGCSCSGSMRRSSRSRHWRNAWVSRHRPYRRKYAG